MRKSASHIQAPHARSPRKYVAVVSALMVCLTVGAIAAEPTETAEAKGIRAYFGMVPAALMNPTLLTYGSNHRAWGRNGPLPDAHHVLIALFNVPEGVRISDATVELIDLAPAGGGSTQKLDVVHIGDAIAYGGLVRLSVQRVHQFEIRVLKPGTDGPVIFHYSYDARH